MKTKLFITLFITGLILSSCKKALDLNPLDQISTATFWKSKGDFDKALTAVYASMQSAEFTSELPARDNLTDNSYGQFNTGNMNDVDQGNLNTSTQGYELSFYNDSYSGIARINIFLQQLTAYNGADVTDAIRKQYQGEAQFIRAFYYFQLYMTYGDVPLVLEPLSLETQKQPNVAAAKILAQIESDLDFSIANLSTNPYFSNGGHAAASSAQAFKARVLLYAAFGTTGTPDLTILAQVRDLCKPLMTQYTLSKNFEDVFRDATQKNNTEIIFSINFLAPNNTNSLDLYYGDWDMAAPLQNFVDSFECTDGLPYGVSPLTNTSAPFTNRDPRLAKTVYVDFVDFGNGLVHHPSNPRPMGYGVIKFLEPSNIPYGFSTLSQQDVVVLRLSEVLLMYAEAENEISGPDATVYQAMTTLRARVNMPPFPAGLTQGEMRDRIRHERRIELAFEGGLRYYDIVRWHAGDQILNNVKDSLLPYHFEDKFYKWPLPQTEIDKSGGVLIQNPDYK
ncbi:RagB/SusD family nutrient uptake outer membrane protein [Pedobacter sp. L105]|uniref:RagB/SusD family nutrient uptake outer membrane protein n=1 Tax=Pedobacter sp. L105 TaxID=1641871 RepID=UPI00131E5A1C|nr:RagB/SusD family nutrient uptake outer membrane protein [Pedobacter sp. L105]